MANTEAQIPPQDLDAEESLLGVMLKSEKAVEIGLGELKPQHFYYEKTHGAIFEAMKSLYDKGLPIDSVSVNDELAKQGKLEVVGGRTKTIELSSRISTVANAAHYTTIVREKATWRATLREAQELQELALGQSLDMSQLQDRLEKMTSTALAGEKLREPKLLGSAMEAYADRMRQADELGGPLLGIKTGFTELDDATLGLHDGQLIVVGARPGQGKSLLVQHIAEHAANAGIPTLLFTLEMDLLQLLQRAAARKCRIPLAVLRGAKLDEKDKATLRVFYKDYLKKLPLYVETNTSLNPTQLRAVARRLSRKAEREHGRPLGLIIVDYVQLMLSDEGNRRDENRTQELTAITRTLKLLAGDSGLKLPVIAVSQLNRALEMRKEKRPMLSDLRDSGSLEQDADMVWFMFREAAYDPDLDERNEHDTEIIVAKAREGEQTTVKVFFDGTFQTFRNRSDGDIEATQNGKPEIAAA